MDKYSRKNIRDAIYYYNYEEIAERFIIPYLTKKQLGKLSLNTINVYSHKLSELYEYYDFITDVIGIQIDRFTFFSQYDTATNHIQKNYNDCPLPSPAPKKFTPILTIGSDVSKRNKLDVIWQKIKDLPSLPVIEHPYFLRKNFKHLHSSIDCIRRNINGADLLIFPEFSPTNIFEISGLKCIFSNGRKKYLTKFRDSSWKNTSGIFCPNKDLLSAKTLFICESQSTVLRFTSMNDYNTWVKKNNNIISVQSAHGYNKRLMIFLKTYSASFKKVFLLADNDVENDVNIGYNTARKAAEKLVTTLKDLQVFLISLNTKNNSDFDDLLAGMI